ncbi:MAG: hypothetical protein KF788_11400 [Piscinibacter sp.]|nr:hypothetical protein [Piscinibacter sp.]
MARLPRVPALLAGLAVAGLAAAQTNPLGTPRPAPAPPAVPTAPAGPVRPAAAPTPSQPLAAGLRISGRIDEATVQGLVCGDLARPFGAVSPEVEGRWSFVPRSASAGSFTYQARNVGGVPGSGSGTYVITRDAAGGGRIKLDGTGSIHSPVGTFSATIYETLTLTPAAGC